jgi:eukaryotic-like serine/threonine-protein kinase
VLAPHMAEIEKLAHPPLVAAAGRVLGQLQREAGQLAAAEHSFDVGLRAAAESGDDAASAGLLLDLAYLIGESRQEPQRGRELLRAAEAAVVRAGKPPELEAILLLDRGVIDEQLGDFADAAQSYTRALELRRAGHAEPGDVAVALQRLCSAEGQLGKLDAAQAHCSEAVDGLVKALGADHPLTAAARSDLAIAYAMHGDLRAARERWEAARASIERSLGENATELAPVLLNLSDVSRMLGDPAAGERYLARAVSVAGTAELAPASLNIRIRVARQLRAAGKLKEGLDMLVDLSRRAEAKLGLDHPVTADALSELAKAYYESDRFTDARDTYARAIGAFRKLYGERHAATLTLEGQYGQALTELHDYAAARPIFERVMLALEATVDAKSPFLGQAYSNLADCLLSLGDNARAVELAEKGFAIRDAIKDDPVQVAESRFIFGRALWAANKDRARAVALVTTSRDEMKKLGPAATSLPAAERWLANAKNR